MNKLNNKIPLVSILVPAYNAEDTIKNSIDSILKQTVKDFEIIIVNDGSTDNTINILSSIKDNRIKIITKHHSGISNSLNIGIKECKGKYIARFDTDDIMLEDRLEIQTNYMEEHDECDVLSTGCLVQNSDDNIEEVNFDNKIVAFNDLLLTNNIIHPTVMFRRSSLEKLDFIYESLYDGCEDYKLWFNCLANGLNIHIVDKKTIIYNNRKNQREKGYINNLYLIERIKQSYTNKNIGDLTCIITFYNEGDEIEKTVSSIRATSKNTRIILVNDNSTDNYNYEKLRDLYNCEYYITPKNLGVAGAREFAIDKCNTKYFVLLDGHMRFYTNDWDEVILNELGKDENVIVCTEGIRIEKNTDVEYINENNKLSNYYPLKAAYIDFSSYHRFLHPVQLTRAPKSYDNKICIKIPCILGAVYAMSKNWWNKIGGLKCLQCYGGDEQLLSISTYLKGGTCKLLSNVQVGHVYKSSYSYHNNIKIGFNYLLLSYLFFDNKTFDNILNNFIAIHGEKTINEIANVFNQNQRDIENFKKLVNTNNKRDIKDFMRFNANYICKINESI